MSARETLRIVEKAADGSDGSVISLEEIRRNLDRDEFVALKQELLEVDVRTRVPFDVFDALWQSIAVSYHGALVENVLIYEELASRVAEADPDRIVVNVTSPKYEAIVRDLERNTDRDVSDVRDVGAIDRLATFYSRTLGCFSAIELVVFVLSLVDQLYCILSRAVSGRVDPDEDAESIVLPYPGRDESVEPIVREMESNCVVVLDSRATMPNALGYDYPHDWTGCDRRTLDSFASPGLIAAQLRLVYALYREMLFDERIASGLSRHLLTSRGVDLPNVIDYAVRTGFDGHLMDFKRALIADYVLSRFDRAERLVTGSNGPMYRIVRSFARERGIDNYYVPHAVAHPIEVENPPHPETKMILSGEFDKEFMEQCFASDQLPELVPLGRPYFRWIRETGSLDTDTEHGESITVLIATQKLEDVRDEFVEDLLTALNDAPQPVKVIVKIHPAEDLAYYRNKFERMDIDLLDRVTLTDEDLATNLGRADVTFTINSNVGIESMIVGTPTVSYNIWQPVIPSYPYATDGAAVLLTSKRELREFVQELSKAQLRRLSEKGQRFAGTNYLADSDAERQIARFIESRQ